MVLVDSLDYYVTFVAHRQLSRMDSGGNQSSDGKLVRDEHAETGTVSDSHICVHDYRFFKINLSRMIAE